MPPITVLIKPASSACNLQCRYCFYHDEAAKRSQYSYGMMNAATLESIVRKTLEYGEGQVGFAFQGGEPALVGLDFYRQLLELQQRYNTKRIAVSNSIQTNGMLIDEAWAQFLAANHFLVGLSLDGPKDIHDLNRLDVKGAGSYSRVAKTMSFFNRHRVEYNILCVVTKPVARHIGQVYQFFVKQGLRYLQFIPCLDGLGEEPGTNPYSLTPELYEDFLKRLFNLWYRDFQTGQRISIRMFDNILQLLLGYAPESCDMKGRCSVNLVIEADGSVYPCDFYVLDQWKMGNINNDSLAAMLQSDRAQAFAAVSAGIAGQCGACQFYPVCRGGCRRHYEPIVDDRITGRNYFCTAYQGFYQYALPGFEEIIRAIGH